MVFSEEIGKLESSSYLELPSHTKYKIVRDLRKMLQVIEKPKRKKNLRKDTRVTKFCPEKIY